VDEATKRPMARTDDAVMAQWMFEWNRPRQWRRPEPPIIDDERPSWLRPRPARDEWATTG
jgi:hypothetical protein